MKRISMVLVAVMAVTIMVFFSGCMGGTAEEKQKPAGENIQIKLMVSAAKSLTDVMGEVKDVYVAKNPEVEITLNFGSSGAMRQQIEQGADVDLFMPAALKDMTALKDKGLIIDDTIVNVLGNKLVMIVPNDSKAALTEFKDVTDVGIEKLALGDPASVPAGKYAVEVLTKIDLLSAVKDKIVYAKDVREVLTWVETGNADAGVVYATDAQISDKVKVVAVASEDSHSPIIYPAAVVGSSKKQDASKKFLVFLCSDDAKAVFEKYGYSFLAK